ncbi:MAG: hypothetical protein H7835_19955 [Magnetococcus sp. XQGC-1]
MGNDVPWSIAYVGYPMHGLARRNGEAVIVGEVRILGVEDWFLAIVVAQNGRFEVVHHDSGRDTDEEIEGVAVTCEEMLHGLGGSKLQVWGKKTERWKNMKTKN